MPDNQADFVVGGRYQNRRGAYEVVEVLPPQMRIRYEDGEVCVVDIAWQARILANIAQDGRSTIQAPRIGIGGRLGGATHNRSHASIAASHRRSVDGPQRQEVARREVELTNGETYSRRSLHERYGGQEQGGISTPRDYPIIFLFTGASGSLYGYKDHWDDDDVFHYTGEGQIGDMEFIRGNKAVRDHVSRGEELHLFETVGGGDVRYIGRMTCVGYDLVSNVPDVHGLLRTAIVFRLTPEGTG